jgi:hypothetical protein
VTGSHDVPAAFSWNTGKREKPGQVEKIGWDPRLSKETRQLPRIYRQDFEIQFFFGLSL